MITAVTSLSSKGQIVLPKEIRKSLSFKEGTRFFIFSEGENIMLKPIKEPDEKEFWDMMEKERLWAEKVGMSEEDISDAIKTVRKNHK